MEKQLIQSTNGKLRKRNELERLEKNEKWSEKMNEMS
jgi:hypothetical protein